VKKPEHTIRFLGIFLGILFGALPFGARAQQVTPDTARASWDNSLVSRLSAAQTGYRNWQKGGASTLAFTAGIDGKANRQSNSWHQKHELRLAYGLVKQDTLDFRKADDVIQLNSALQYRGEGFFRAFNPTIAGQVRTQFSAGYNYKSNPFRSGPLQTLRPPVKISDFMAPATFTQSLGITYDPVRWFNQRIGLGAKETVVLIDRFRPLYGLDTTGAPIQLEIGVESRTRFEREIFQNVRWRTSLGVFAAFNNPDLPDLQWENLVVMKVNAWLSVNVEFEALYDRDVRISDGGFLKNLQIKEVLSLGFSFVIL
jgi:hypothetical protein